MELLQVVLSGFSTGGVYALVAIGHALIWGLMGLVNFANGDMLMIGMYVAYGLWAFSGMDPIIAAPIAGVVMFIMGVAIYYIITKRVLKAHRYAQIFATYGLAIFLRSSAQFLFTANYKMVNNQILTGAIQIGSISIGKAQLFAGVVALLLSLLLYFILSNTNMGRAMRATSEDGEIANAMGINADIMFALAWGIAGACVGIAGALMSNYYYIYPDVGIAFSTIASAIVCLGGLGNIPGAVAAALGLGIVETVASYYVSSQYKLAIVYVLYILIVAYRALSAKRRKHIKKVQECVLGDIDFYNGKYLSDKNKKE